MIRKRYIVDGFLYLLGYRTLVKFFAHKHNIKGYIRYQRDETMEIVCEGSKKNLASFLKEIRIKDDISVSLGFHVLSIRQKRISQSEKLGCFEIWHYRAMTEYEKEKDRMTDTLMLTYSWAAHKDSERIKSEKSKMKSKPRLVHIHPPPRQLY